MIEKLSAEIKSAMKSKDSDRLMTLRGLMSEAKNIAINDKRKDVKPEDVVVAVTKGVKLREDAYSTYIDAGRQDLAIKETYEMNILKEFQPKQLTDIEIISIVDDVIATFNAPTKKDTGAVMGAVMQKISKGSADGKLIAKIVGSKLK